MSYVEAEHYCHEVADSIEAFENSDEFDESSEDIKKILKSSKKAFRKIAQTLSSQTQMIEDTNDRIENDHQEDDQRNIDEDFDGFKGGVI